MSTVESTTLRRYLEQFTGTFTPELAEHFASLPPNPAIQSRVDELATKCNEGQLTEEEHREYSTYVDVMGVIALLRARAMKAANSDAGSD